MNHEQLHAEVMHESAEAAAAGEPWTVNLSLDEGAAIALVGALQLALRHPSFAKRASYQMVANITRSIVGSVPPGRPKLSRVLHMGFNQEFDIPK